MKNATKFCIITIVIGMLLAFTILHFLQMAC